MTSFETILTKLTERLAKYNNPTPKPSKPTPIPIRINILPSMIKILDSGRELNFSVDDQKIIISPNYVLATPDTTKRV